jgi:hypothetical protein
LRPEEPHLLTLGQNEWILGTIAIRNLSEPHTGVLVELNAQLFIELKQTSAGIFDMTLELPQIVITVLL